MGVVSAATAAAKTSLVVCAILETRLSVLTNPRLSRWRRWLSRWTTRRWWPGPRLQPAQVVIPDPSHVRLPAPFDSDNVLTVEAGPAYCRLFFVPDLKLAQFTP